MTRAIDRDAQRFKEIVRGKIRGDLRKYISHGEMLGRKGREIVSIPVPNVDIPHFRHGRKGSGGVGQGDGEEEPVIVPMREDEEYRSWKPVVEPHTNAAVIYMMDVSGSMTDEQKEIVRIESFWIDTWLKKQYDGVQRRY